MSNADWLWIAFVVLCGFGGLAWYFVQKCQDAKDEPVLKLGADHYSKFRHQCLENMVGGDMPSAWAFAFAAGWKVERCSCSCGGAYAWLRPRDSGAYEMVGCVCHTEPRQEKVAA